MSTPYARISDEHTDWYRLFSTVENVLVLFWTLISQIINGKLVLKLIFYIFGAAIN